MNIIEGSADVASTVAALKRALDARGIEVFAEIDHAAGARSVGLQLDDEVAVIFGNPAVGTRLMQLDRSVGVELPLRMLIWAESGTTRIGYQDPHRLASEFVVGAAAQVLDGMSTLLAALATEIS